ncbi:MAG: hypothetical protein ACP5EQ_07380, partial [Candidatus Cloacimonadia bacterium]
MTFPLVAYRDGLININDHRKFLEKSQYWSHDEILNYQLDKIKTLLIHAYETTSFYQKRCDDSGFDPYYMRYHDDLTKIPPLTKKDLQENIESMRSKSYSDRDVHRDATGGSTGAHTP